ncbi:hypothetical protein C8N26_1142 [Tenacibaculum lutimaris]|uniref:Nicotinate-nucleotide adenylyltransferase n=1 Tax=Tenacibaculum lutimaris TaxID=285258 RepID=A0A420E2U8_9FLAO|nr:hypothetical protein [Tenacibaculum lutimaris]RKF04471.1 hypothetical protein C8N26_1142 [Tenacibaculum lutimaris]
MKKLVFGLFLLGLTNLAHSQNDVQKNIILEPVTIKPLNLSYLKEVQREDTPEFTVNLQNEAARYDITEDPIFDKEFEAYEVIFKSKNDETSGLITATYDSKGKIMSSIERYKNVLLPKTVRTAINNKYPGWIIYKDVYLVTYRDNSKSKQVFKVQIRKDGEKKNLKLDYEGNIH